MPRCIQSAEVSGQVAIADAARIEALTGMFRRFGHAPLSADVHARTIYLTQIGYISMKSSEDLAVRMKRIPDYVEIFTGRAPKARELDRFFARHCYSPEERRVKAGAGK